MRRRWLIERPVAFGAVCAVSAVVIGMFQDKTLEQQGVNVLLGFIVGAVVSLLVRLLFSRVGSKR